MPKIDIPEGADPIHLRALSLRPEYKQPWVDMVHAVHDDSILSVREREVSRLRIAWANGCLMCQAARPEAEVPEAVYADVLEWRTSRQYSDRERLCVEFTERFALDHESLDDAFFDKLREHFSEEEIFDLTYSCARNLGFGRLTHVLGLDDSCEIGVVSALSASV